MWTVADMVNHLLILPIVLPLLVGALLVLLEKAQSRWVGAVSLASVLALVWVAVQLLLQADTGAVQAYLLGNWRAPWGIALAADRLTALMLMLTSLVALASLVYALGGDDRKGLHFHALLQFQLMGLNGAFLTADLFNLFVFFEVLLAASYGLLLHGASAERLKASVHYVVFNLAGSALFLIAVSLLYALAGTLNMADLAVKLPQLGPENTALAQAAVLLLVVVFAVKAALLPLYFWLPATYAAALAPVAALFAIMTKVGVYAIARISTLMTGSSSGGSLAGLLTTVLPVLALATLVLAAIGALAAQRLRGLVAYLVVASAGTLLLAIGLGTPGTLAAGLFYVVNSTLIACLWFLLADRIAWARGGDDALRPRPLQYGWGLFGGLFFVAAVAVAGVPPLAGFFGKALLLQAAGTTALGGWVVGLVLGSSLLMMVALARAGSQLFWKPAAGSALPPLDTPPRLQHHAALFGLLGLVLACAVFAGPLQTYAQATAQQLTDRRPYLDAVLGAQPAPAAHDVRQEMRERGELK
ncbi:monovalent cation/H+ antiporter subunit D [Sphaerotilus sp.]|uniref:monovalent cation/H+ antiporter subunit D n=1 Tax=Sphaerotilus sp. TaxID=2093942 RepID=UPI002ACD3440|nr:monovalent cation/H+ antiporter subunit D [Sphaerotilus sp.]MDZ7854835.1 monovalent cation/H+ antiporter subunit D [Sphaerotilus sp.]